jgi:hypothetical protein
METYGAVAVIQFVKCASTQYPTQQDSVKDISAVSVALRIREPAKRSTSWRHLAVMRLGVKRFRSKAGDGDIHGGCRVNLGTGNEQPLAKGSVMTGGKCLKKKRVHMRRRITRRGTRTEKIKEIEHTDRHAHGWSFEEDQEDPTEEAGSPMQQECL